MTKEQQFSSKGYRIINGIEWAPVALRQCIKFKDTPEPKHDDCLSWERNNYTRANESLFPLEFTY